MLDWNAVRGAKRAAELKGEWDVLLPSVAAHEAITSQNPLNFTNKLFEFVRLHNSRTFQPQNPMHMIAREVRKQKLVTLDYILNRPGAQVFREHFLTPHTFTQENLDDSYAHEQHKHYEQERTDFLALVNDFWNFSQRDDTPKVKIPPIDKAHEWLKDPKLTAELLGAKPFLKGQPAAWSLPAFPATWAVNRYLRLVMWYCIKLAQLKGVACKDFENNYDDCQYAFYSSYTGHLATNDGQLAGMVGVIFPTVRVHSIESVYR